MQETTTRPQKTREMHNMAMDSTRWNDFKFRDGDIVIGTWAKSGTGREPPSGMPVAHSSSSRWPARLS